MNTKDVTTDEVVKNLNTSFENLDATRTEELKTSDEILKVKNKSRRKERDRLIKKYGKDHPRVQNIESKLSYGIAAEKGIEVEIQNNDFDQDTFPKDSWRVNGRIINNELSEIPKLTISLFDDKNKWVKDLGSACTKNNGHFSLTVTDESGKLFEKYKGKGLYLTVSKDNKEIIKQEKEPVFMEIGKIEYRQIILNEKECPPPPVEPVKKTWIVKGTVKNKTDNGLIPIKDVIVKMADRENKFAELLGEKKTGNKGEFEFKFTSEEIKELIEVNPPIFVSVFDQNGKKIYNSTKPIKGNLGKVEVLKIVI